MESENKKWVMVGVGCVFTGALIAIFTQRPYWFAAGGVMGASLVGYRLYTTNNVPSNENPISISKMKRVLQHDSEFTTLGAPQIPQKETPRVNEGTDTFQTREGVDGYPMMFRVPGPEVHLDPMDDRIRAHFTGPLGPENDPVRYWA